MFAFAQYVKRRICGLVQQAPAIHHPAGADELGDCLEEPHNKQEVIPMRSIVTYALPIILAAGISGMMFTATLA
ncbi:hypothetical protein [Novosphingobium cyanobacteriorum]|uniref:Uncharacterized protein n=1 Tax=Novosphingobium cyanobacteriorum TaxID=3024215 RepID=A0ABT6CH51_9SPHN|nr:hypothetical protein [Novosphingobium cyanobacteriorum]MDF8333106.1 hypothetical protein [Novosphingobium cyanobacteriorum]